LRYLSNNKPVRLINATEYEVTKCSEAYKKYRIRALSFHLEKNQGIALPQIDIFGAIKVTPGGAGSPAGGGTLWYKRYIDFYPIHVGHTKNLNQTVEIEFPDLIFSERDDAYIDLEMTKGLSLSGPPVSLPVTRLRKPLDDFRNVHYL
jgi:hypothetical protein